MLPWDMFWLANVEIAFFGCGLGCRVLLSTFSEPALEVPNKYILWDINLFETISLVFEVHY